MHMKERLQKIIAAAGIDSRRHAEQMIAEGRVSVNNIVVTKMGTKADTAEDVIRIDGKTISIEKNLLYIIVHKPAGYVTTLNDPQKRPTVVDLITDVPERVFPVGRLDYDSEGLLIMTNDGNFAQKVQHPRFQLPKVYRIKIQGRLTAEETKRLSKGIRLEDGIFKPENLQIEKFNDKSCWLRLTLREGKNRIIRRGFEAIGHRVARLIRESIGSVQMGKLKEGSWRHLTGKEIGQLSDNKVIETR
jgi:23S rRNA pseudouridine2605 synthase